MLSFLKRLLSSSGASRTYTDRLPGNGSFDVEVISKQGDWQNLEIFWTATSNKWEHKDAPDGGDYFEREVYAQLVPDETNRNNPHAIEVEVAGKRAGYLSTHDAV